MTYSSHFFAIVLVLVFELVLVLVLVVVLVLFQQRYDIFLAPFCNCVSIRKQQC